MTVFVTSNLINQKVSFISKNATDSSSYVGTIMGMVSYAIAGTYGDVVSYNAAVQKADNTVGNANTLNYFLIALDNGQTQPTIIVFADEWIANGSFDVIQQAAIYTFNIYDIPAKGLAQIQAVLQSSGYNAVQITDPNVLALAQAQGTTTVVNTV